DIIDNDKKTKNVFFKYMNKINHIVFEEFIMNHLIDDYKVINKNVFLVPHPMKPQNKLVEKTIDCVSLGNIDDEEFLKNLIDLEEKDSFFKKNNLVFVLKSKSINYDDSFLIIKSGYLSIEEYNNYLVSSKCVLIYYPSTYKFRISGIAIEAIGSNVKIFCNDIEVFSFYKNKYPGIITILNEKKDILKYILDKNNIYMNCDSRDEFILNHSMGEVAKKINQMILEINRGQ
ncbi:MAG: hypothetical protein K5765_08535, partial [Clostridia bacterium]|nr:hypothetical protein [Clostridia bacterium]